MTNDGGAQRAEEPQQPETNTAPAWRRRSVNAIAWAGTGLAWGALGWAGHELTGAGFELIQQWLG